MDKPQEDTKAQGEKLQVQEMNLLDGQGEVTEEINKSKLDIDSRLLDPLMENPRSIFLWIQSTLDTFPIWKSQRICSRSVFGLPECQAGGSSKKDIFIKTTLKYIK